MSLPIVYVTAEVARMPQVTGRLDHVHNLQNGMCVKDRAGDCPVGRLVKDPFRNIRGQYPHPAQHEFMKRVLPLVEGLLERWGAASGKTTARLMLAKAIIDGDNNG